MTNKETAPERPGAITKEAAPTSTNESPANPRRLGKRNAPTIRIREGRRYCAGKPFARWWWENNVGKIPPHYEIHHADGNPLNDSPSNLRLIHRRDHARLEGRRVRTKFAPSVIIAAVDMHRNGATGDQIAETLGGSARHLHRHICIAGDRRRAVIALALEGRHERENLDDLFGAAESRRMIEESDTTGGDDESID